jgi:hypothetical protein
VQQQIGGEVIVGLALTNVVLWVLLRPPGVAGTMYPAEIFATTAIVLLSCSLVLATRVPDPNRNEPGCVLGQVALIGLVLLLLWALAPRLSAVMRRIPTKVQRWFMQ